MELDYLSDAWVSALSERLAASESFAKAAKGFKGSLALATVAQPEAGVEPAAVLLDLANGACARAERVAGPGPYEADYVIRGGVAEWQKLLAKAIFPVPAIMGGQLQLVKGGTMALMTQMGAMQALLDEAGALPTRYPG